MLTATTTSAEESRFAAALKRPRNLSPAPSDLSDDSTAPSEGSKLLRTSTSPAPPSIVHLSSAPLQCNFPPTCSPPNKPTILSSSHEMEVHYATYHTHVCAWDRCNKIFPDERLLDLHFSECHDPLTAVRKERGERTFSCHLATCPRLFQTPKGRRLHLISAHGFPKQYFFAVTNKGIGGLLHKYGSGASLLRGEWRERKGSIGDKGGDNQSDEEEDDEEEEEPEEAGKAPLASNRSPTQAKKPVGREQPPHLQSPTRSPTKPKSQSAPQSKPATTSPARVSGNQVSVDALTKSINSLSLVPPSIRFGRGGKKGGFVGRPKETSQGHGHAGGGTAGRGRGGAAGNVGNVGRKAGNTGIGEKMPMSP